MNKALLESRTKLLAVFASEFSLFVTENDIKDFVNRYEKQSLAQSKALVKEAKRVLFANINNHVFSEIIAKMNADKITIAELARRMDRTHQQVSRIFKSRNPTVTTLNNIKKALYGNDTL